MEPSEALALAALLVSLATVAVAAVTFFVALKSSAMQARAERRDFANRLDEFALWYARTLMSGKDPGPTDAFIPGLASLIREADRMSDKSALRLASWSSSVLGKVRRTKGSQLGAPLFAAMAIGAVASSWVRDPKHARLEEAIKSETDALSL